MIDDDLRAAMDRDVACRAAAARLADELQRRRAVVDQVREGEEVQRALVAEAETARRSRLTSVPTG